MTDSRRQNLLALTIYALAATVMLVGPMGLNFHNRLIGAEGFIFLWSLVWWPWAILHGLNPLYTHFIWVPAGQNLLWVTSIPSVAIIMAPVTMLFGPLASYNLVAVVAPTVGAWSAYLLVREITGKFFPALFGGWVFGFSGYEFGHLLGEVNMFVTCAIPLLVWLYILRWRGKVGRVWYVALATVLLVFEFGVSTEIFATLVPFGLLAIVAAAAFAAEPDQRRRHLAGLGQTVAALAVALVLLAPCLYYALFVGYVHGAILSPSVIVADPFSYLMPTGTNWLGHWWLGQPGQPHWLTRLEGLSYEQDAYLGLPLLLLVILYLREFIDQKSTHVLVFMLAVVFVASLGPRLHLPVHTPHVWLPWRFLVHWPLLDKVLPARLSLYVSLGVAVMGGWWMAFSRHGRGLKITLAAVVVISLLPNTFGGTWIYPLKNPPFFSSPALKRYIPPGTTVVIYPDGLKGSAMFWQAEADFRFAMAGGYIGTQIPPAYNTPLARAGLSPGLGQGAEREIRRFLAEHHVGAIIVPLKDYAGATTPFSFLGIHPIITGGVRLYLLRRTDAQGPMFQP